MTNRGRERRRPRIGRAPDHRERLGPQHLLAVRLAAIAVLPVLVLLLQPGHPTATPEPGSPSAGTATRLIIEYEHPSSAQLAGDRGLLAERGFRVVEVPPGADAGDLARSLRADPAVRSAEVDPVVRAAGVPNDPFYGVSQAAYLEPLGAPSAWGLHSGDGEVVIAVVDTGLDTSHPEFEGHLWTNPNETPGNGIDDDQNGCIDDVHGCRFLDQTPVNAELCSYSGSTRTGAIEDDHGASAVSSHSHGTLVAGAAAAAGDNGAGVAGAAWNAQIMALKVLDCGEAAGCPCGTMSTVAEAVLYATRNGADIVNLSLASNSSVDDTAVMRDALTIARNAGVVVVAATGNHTGADPGVGYPAAYAGRSQFTNVVAVGASDNRAGNVEAAFTNSGPEVTIAAPGLRIAGPVRLSIAPSQPYGADSGTSFSAALVSGLLAIVKSRNPELTVPELVDILQATATPVEQNDDNWAGAGIVHFGRALGAIPMTLSGDALHDWKDVADGTPIDATIDGNLCASTAVSNDGTFGRYLLEIPSGDVVPGCGAIGREVNVFLDGVPVPGSLPWPAGGGSLAIQQDLNTVTPEPGPVIIEELAAGWNNLAQLGSAAPVESALAHLPSGWQIAYHWVNGGPSTQPDGAGGYLRAANSGPPYLDTWSTAAQFDTYWIFLPESANVAVQKPPSASRTVALERGWNNFVYTGPTASIRDVLQPIAGSYSVVGQYQAAGQRFASHLPNAARYLNDFEALHPMTAYWIYVTHPVAVTFG